MLFFYEAVLQEEFNYFTLSSVLKDNITMSDQRSEIRRIEYINTIRERIWRPAPRRKVEPRGLNGNNYVVEEHQYRALSSWSTIHTD